MRFFFVLLIIPGWLSGQVNLSLGLIAHYPFNGNANDVSGNNINGAVTNAVLTTDKTNAANSAYYFNGTDAFILLPFSSLYNFAPQDSFSISVWVLPDQGNNWPAQAIVVKSPPHPDFTLSAWNYGTYLLSYKAMNGYAYNHILNGTTTFVNNPCWYNMIVTYKNGVWKQYINGALESSDLSQTRFILQDGTSRIAFGKKGESFGDWYKGKMDEVRIYNRVLNQQEVNALADKINLTVSSSNMAVCRGDSIQLTAGGASFYSWSPATGLSNTSIANPKAAPTQTTTYIITATNIIGCPSKDSLTITVNPIPSISKSNDVTICQNNTTQIWATGGLNYKWTPSLTLNDPNISNPIASPNITTKYVVLVTDINNCKNTDSVQVSVRIPNIFTIRPPANICSLDSIRLDANGGDLYSWIPSASLSNASLKNPLASPSINTTYSVAITDTVCNNTVTLTTDITVLPLPRVVANKSNDVDCSYGQATLLATGAATYRWASNNSLSNTSISNPVASPTTTTTYYVVGTDINNCSNNDSVTVELKNSGSGKYFMPSAFTPNNDGLNDCYKINLWGVTSEVEFSIYNRWGERIFYSKQPYACWDGTYKNVPQNPGVYIYIVKARNNCENEIFRKGTLMLIR